MALLLLLLLLLLCPPLLLFHCLCVSLTWLRSALVKTRPTLPTSWSSRGSHWLLPVSSQYSLMERFIMVFLPIRMMLSGRRAWVERG